MSASGRRVRGRSSPSLPFQRKARARLPSQFPQQQQLAGARQLPQPSSSRKPATQDSEEPLLHQRSSLLKPVPSRPLLSFLSLLQPPPQPPPPSSLTHRAEWASVQPLPLRRSALRATCMLREQEERLHRYSAEQLKRKEQTPLQHLRDACALQDSPPQTVSPSRHPVEQFFRLQRQLLHFRGGSLCPTSISQLADSLLQAASSAPLRELQLQLCLTLRGTLRTVQQLPQHWAASEPTVSLHRTGSRLQVGLFVLRPQTWIYLRAGGMIFCLIRRAAMSASERRVRHADLFSLDLPVAMASVLTHLMYRLRPHLDFQERVRSISISVEIPVLIVFLLFLMNKMRLLSLIQTVLPE